ncbi:MAG: hypothetical protein KY464_15190 [Gemmatimonadetes bacterium]|nr:hypothetical protein [Gemmatimonadota bacterium]
MRYGAAIAVVLVAAAAACDSSAMLEPTLDSTESVSAAVAPGGVSHAAGRATITVPDPLIEAKPEEYSFTAIAAGRSGAPSVDAKGQMEFRTHRTAATGGDLRVHAEVVCLAGDPSSAGHARIGAIIRQSSNPTLFPIGSGLIFGVTDRGEGSKGPPDLASSPLTVIIGDGSGAVDEAAVHAYLRGYCQAGVSPAQHPVQNGNIQVKQKG